jgi:hypothetical protein
MISTPKILLLFVAFSSQLAAYQTAYEKKEHQADWDYQQNWRYDKEEYLEGGIQPEIDPTIPPYGKDRPLEGYGDGR